MQKIDEIINQSTENAVQYHNDCQDTYFFGNSIVGASGKPDGELSFVIGPDYTCPNYLKSEKLYLVAEGRKIELNFEMKRIRHSGVFFGFCHLSDASVYMWDFAPSGISAILRFFYVRSDKFDASQLKLCAEILPFECDASISVNRLSIKKDTSRYCFGNRETLNWANRYCDIYFNGGSDMVSALADDKYIIEKATDSNGFATLVHNCYYDAPRELEGDILLLLQKTINDWESWLSRGKMPYIEDQRAADALESLLLSVKMQQNRDGGAIAGIRKYANSYVRDTHGAMRILMATEHYSEVALLLRNIHTRWEISGFIPNWWSMGSDSFIGHSFHNDAAEVTSYYIFMARDYYKKTKDRQLLGEIAPSLSWAADVQMKWLEEHDYTMDFNGDETEQYCCYKDGQEYGCFKDPRYPWDAKALSFSSMCAALCSMEWWYSFSDADTGSIEPKLARLRNKIDEIFYRKNEGIHAWSAKPSDNGYSQHEANLTNYLLFPLWIGATLNDNGEIKDAAAVKNFVNPNGFLPNSPEAMPGFCGHTMGLFLYDMLLLGDEFSDAAEKAVQTILNSDLLSMYGTVSEFYGPSCVPNGHNCRPFEGGIVGEALIKYHLSKKSV